MTGVWVAAAAAIAAAGLSLYGVFVTKKSNCEIASLQKKLAESLERSRQKHLSSLVAPEKRLEVHQQAYTRWLKLHHTVKNPSDDSADKLLRMEAEDCWTWWSENCLYFNAEVEEELIEAAQNASLYSHKGYRRRMTSDEKAAIQKQIHRTPDIIRQAVGLPNLGEESGLSLSSEEVRKGE